MCDPSSFGVEVFDYNLCVNGDAENYSDHEFTVRIWMGQHMYGIQRSYSSFCLFDAQLRRRYPRSKLPTLPLLGKEQFKQLKTGTKMNGTVPPPEEFIKSAVGNIGASISVFGNGVPLSSGASAASSFSSSFAGGVNDSFGGASTDRGRDSGRRSIRRIDTTEVIQQKKMPLTLYLQHLLMIPEILQSDSLLAFLDEENPDGEPLDEESLHSGLSSIDILLSDETPIHKRVLRQHTLTFNVEEGFIIVWKFSTKNHDIGFSVSFSGTEVLTYQRINSHIKPVAGLFDVPSKGQVIITFDNTYSRMHTKNLTYVVRVAEAPEYEVAKETAIYKAKERHTLLEQRSLLQKSLAAISKSLIASSGLGFALKGAEQRVEARFRTMSTWEGELAQLRDEKKSLTHALEESIRALEVERNAFAESVGRLEESAAIKEATEEELNRARAELEQLRHEAQEERERHVWAIEELQASRDCALEAIDQARREMAEAKSIKDQTELAESLKTQLMVEKEENAKFADQISRLKAEKRLLKTTYLQSKSDVDRLTHERQMQAAETDRLREELRLALDSRASRSQTTSVERGAADSSQLAAALLLESKSAGGGLLSAYANDLSDKLSKIGESVFRPQTPVVNATNPVNSAPTLFVDNTFGF